MLIFQNDSIQRIELLKLDIHVNVNMMQREYKTPNPTLKDIVRVLLGDLRTEENENCKTHDYQTLRGQLFQLQNI